MSKSNDRSGNNRDKYDRGSKSEHYAKNEHNESISSESSRNSGNSNRTETRNKYDQRSKNTNSVHDSNNSQYENTSGVPEQTFSESLNDIQGTNLGCGSCVMIKANGIKGVIKWIGYYQDPNTLWVGIETEDKIETDNSGNWEIHNNLKKPFKVDGDKLMYVEATEIVDDPRYNDSMYQHHSAIENDLSLRLKEFAEIPGKPALPAQEILKLDDLKRICGKFKGIQGHHNSCYLDATVFSMFAFTNIFDSLLNKDFTEEDFPTFEFQKILREAVVNPLRLQGYVPWKQVMKLRYILDRKEGGYTKEEKDPEEFLNMLFVDIFKAEPLLKLNSGEGSFFYQLFVEKDERLTFPTVQQLFDQSFSSSDVKLTEVPSCLIIQMPRFGNKYKMYPQILPSHVLDITDILVDSPRQCTLCGKLAEKECVDCFNTANEVSLETSTFCLNCFTVYHKHTKRINHKKVKIIQNASVQIETFKNMRCNVERIFMELFAVVCIETSHYVSFVKTGRGQNVPWCFFDSMADRIGGADGYNIPELTPEVEISQFLSDDNTNVSKVNKQAKRLLGDAYMCMYQSDDMRKYK